LSRVSEKIEGLLQLFLFHPRLPFFLSFKKMLTLLFGYDHLRQISENLTIDLHKLLSNRAARKTQSEIIRWHLALPPDSPYANPLHFEHFQEMERDAAKLQLLNLLEPKLLEKIIGVKERNTNIVKKRCKTVIQTLDQKLQVNLEIVKNDTKWWRKKFERRIVAQLDELTVLCTDVNRIIAAFAIL
jgi:hypothetical protein